MSQSGQTEQQLTSRKVQVCEEMPGLTFVFRLHPLMCFLDVEQVVFTAGPLLLRRHTFSWLGWVDWNQLSFDHEVACYLSLFDELVELCEQLGNLGVSRHVSAFQQLELRVRADRGETFKFLFRLTMLCLLNNEIFPK